MKTKTPQSKPTAAVNAGRSPRSRAAHGSASTTVTQTELAAAFTEWDRRYREEPERFQAEAVRLLKETPETYGEACAPYLLAILKEQRGR